MDTEEPLAPLEDACTVVLLRDGTAGLEVLMLERPGSSSAFGGAWVFPGGKVDLQDRSGTDGTPLHEDFAARTAGVREVLEETGQRLDPDRLIPLSRWTPMQRIPRRFRTWFLVAAAPSGQVVLNPAEHDSSLWLTPADALARHAREVMKLVPPTWVTLYQLGAFATVAQALDHAAAGVPFAYDSYLLANASDHHEGSRLAGIVWAGDEQYPRAAEAGKPGARHRLNMSALPWTFERTGEH